MPVQPAHYQAVTPLRPIGPETVSVFNDLGIPDRFHRNIREIVDQFILENWEDSLLELKVVDANNVHDLVEAMKVDAGLIPRC
jgi:hypothetical protein